MVLQVHDAVSVEHTSTSSITLEWNANPVNDMLADSVLAVILQLESNPRNFKGTQCTRRLCQHDHMSVQLTHVPPAPPSDIHARQRTIKRIVEGNFGKENVSVEGHEVRISVDERKAVVHLHPVLIPSRVSLSLSLCVNRDTHACLCPRFPPGEGGRRMDGEE
jgi:hypothetical protein